MMNHTIQRRTASLPVSGNGQIAAAAKVISISLEKKDEELRKKMSEHSPAYPILAYIAAPLKGVETHGEWWQWRKLDNTQGKLVDFFFLKVPVRFSMSSNGLVCLRNS